MFVVVGVSGGIAAYKTVQVVRALVTNGHEVHVVPTEDSLRFVGTATWEAISRHPVTTSVHDDVAEVRHVALGTQADLVIVAPATANTLAKMAAGISDNLLGVTLLATTAPVVVAPAMHTAMWDHAATQANISTLRSRGVHIVGPADGPLTGGDSGPGRMVEPDEIVAAALDVAGAPASDLAALRVAVSTGGTREPIDPVRFLGNRSSGKQGAAVALAAADRGAFVHLVAAHVDEGVLDKALHHPRIAVERASTAVEMDAAMRAASTEADVVVMAAAVADFSVPEVSDVKIRKEDGTVTLDLVENPDVLIGLVQARRPGQTIVGFAAETAADDAELRERGIRKRARKGVDLLAVNRVGWQEGFETAENRVLFVDATDEVASQAAGTKRVVADALWDAVLRLR
ncbi:phosphopantothenoylcysteine decarboxylase / phosphopantothenate--cysteine ligase [Microbacterium sp. LKL04]|uniref:bifunctional phosphopantothenoylcysteine decarboxylase/phosphopantothenate--cysteine ligase CoaBC n=1 Tax=unclassified Microbacterium TaxID=2609290 RepID=UPI000875BB99|nr:MULTISPECIES: bifunctional phosphopantothenoylcysteine decarboxylase/phosphopantothenate--cysteine ligase CoaBC [unclassified Microbacterium]MDQ1126510.1 phosphopantothenoylcysteine decarboxylase/phosphopantothenate--cysteine ligase [Microbacterium sp. SORGH_AS_0505]SCX95104.1 phosphopantothenoylcysteine decarboxylase / phosphopantothenate--cysteine ligase [Microbacterium sp. LKL04]